MRQVLQIRRSLSVLCLATGIASLTLLTINKYSTTFTNEPFISENSLDLSNMDSEEREFFFLQKELTYRQRRTQVAKVCKRMEDQKKNSAGYGYSYREHSIIYDTKDKLAYCAIPKVASSTWCKHFAVLSGVKPEVLQYWKYAIQIFAPSLWPLPKDGRSLPELFENVDLSFVVVRHPFSRLASVYFEKFLFNYGNAWNPVAKYIIKKYRKSPSVLKTSMVAKLEGIKSEIYPTPEEYLHYVIEDWNGKGIHANEHWLPQYTSCPFCAVNFTVYSKMEELAEDTAYIIYKSGLEGKIMPSLKANSKMNPGREAVFWQNVPSDVVKTINDIYRPDLEMFNYSAETYFRDLGIKVDSSWLKRPELPLES